MFNFIKRFTAKKNKNNNNKKNSNNKKNNNSNNNTKRRKNSQIKIYKDLYYDSLVYNKQPLYDFVDDILKDADGKTDLQNIKFVIKQLLEYQEVISDENYTNTVLSKIVDIYGKRHRPGDLIQKIKQRMKVEKDSVKKSIDLLHYKIIHPRIDRWSREYRQMLEEIEEENRKIIEESTKKRKMQYEKWKKHTGKNITYAEFHERFEDGEFDYYNFDTGRRHNRKIRGIGAHTAAIASSGH